MAAVVCPECGKTTYKHCGSRSCPWRRCGNPKCDVNLISVKEKK